MNIYMVGACVGLGLVIGSIGLLLNTNHLMMFGLGLGLIVGCIFRHIKKSIEVIQAAQVEKSEIN